MKLTIRSDLSESNLRFAAQLGVTHIMADAGQWMDENRRGPVQRDKLLVDKQRVESLGMKFIVAILPQDQGSIHWNIRLGTPHREQEILDICQSIEILASEGFEVLEYVFNLAAVPGSELTTGRGGATVRHFNYDKWKNANINPQWAATEDQIWDRIEWFLSRIVPVAEKVGLKLACHPDDPPVPTMCGETRVTGSLNGMQRLVDLVPSPVNGLNFCIGTVIEMGIDVIAALQHFGAAGKINHIHYRNVKGSIPSFDESFLDDGDLDMAQAFATLKNVGYTGPIMPDHWPTLEGHDREIGRAYDLGYLRALMIA